MRFAGWVRSRRFGYDVNVSSCALAVRFGIEELQDMNGCTPQLLLRHRQSLAHVESVMLCNHTFQLRPLSNRNPSVLASRSCCQHLDAEGGVQELGAAAGQRNEARARIAPPQPANPFPTSKGAGYHRVSGGTIFCFRVSRCLTWLQLLFKEDRVMTAKTQVGRSL